MRTVHLLAALLVPAALTPAPAATAAPLSGPVFEDFLGPAGAPPDPARWGFDIGPSAEKGWEPGSLQTYTDSPDNVGLDGQGNLVLTARRTEQGYTSARITTRDRADFGFGTVSARIKMPAGQGVWPAFWMLGSSIGTLGWPDCGEVDIIELVNTADTYYLTLHGPRTKLQNTGPAADLATDFHTFWTTRRPGLVTIGIDDATLATFTPESLPPGAPWVFDTPMFVLLNVAVGGDWPGPPTEDTPFPATMVVDWFRFDPI